MSRVCFAAALAPLWMIGSAEASTLTGLSAVVTGSNKGIGFAVCRQLLHAGVSIVVTARDVQRGQAALSLLRLEYNGELALGFVQMDVADDQSVTQSVEGISSLLGGKLDILVNNAGVAYPDAIFGPEEAQATVNINALGTIRATRALLPLLSQSSAGRVINVASIESSLAQLSRPLQQRVSDASLTDEQVAALMNEYVEAVASGSQRRVGWGGTMYHASKVGQLAFAASLAQELTRQRSNVTVASCCPGFVRTDMSDSCYGPGLGHKSTMEGADTPVWLALMSQEQARASHGSLFADRRVVRNTGWA